MENSAIISITTYFVLSEVNSAFIGRILISFSFLNHFLKFNIENPTTSSVSGLTLRKKSSSISFDIAFWDLPIKI